MVNVAAMTLLLNNSRGGFGFGGGGSSEKINDRYADLKSAAGGFRIDGTSVITAYLDGRCKLTAYGTATDVQNMFGEHASVKRLDDSVAEYKAEAEKRLNMVTPPSFLEKIMVLRRSMGYTKAGKALSTSTLGMSSLAAGMISLAARSYGRAKGFVLDRFGEKDKNKQSFSQRLSDLKRREDLKDDLKKLNRLEKVSKAVSADDYLRYQAKYDRPAHNYSTTRNKILEEYLGYNSNVWVTDDGALEKTSWFGTYKEGVPLKDVDEALKKTEERIGSVALPSGAEKILMKADRWLNRRNRNKPVTSSLTQAASAVIGRAVDNYVAAREKKDPSFKGKLSLYTRFAEIRSRREYEQDAVKLKALQKKITGR